MVLRSYALRFSLICATALYGGCGDDSGDGNGSEQRDAAIGGDAAATGTDGGKPDTGTGVDSGSRVVDSGTRDSAVSNLDSGQTNRDSGVADTGAADTGTDAGGGSASAACVKCEASECRASDLFAELADVDFSKLCETFGDATATGGDQVGELRKTLCEKYLECARRTGCADGLQAAYSDNESFSCFCGSLSVSDCQMKKASELDGPCAIEAAGAFETSEAQFMLERAISTEFAGGMATWTLRCDLHVCADECYAPCKDKAAGSACGDPGCTPDAGTFCLPGSEPQTCTAGSCSNFAQGADPEDPNYLWVSDGGTP